MDVVRQLLTNGASVNASDGIGITPLIAAASVNDAAVVNLLLAHGADATAASKGPVGTALRVPRPTEIPRSSRRSWRGARTWPPCRSTPQGRSRTEAVQFGHVTALHLAVLSGNADVVRQILAAGAAVDALDIRGMTPLMFAIGTDRPDPRIVRMLLQGGASVDAPIESRRERDRLGEEVSAPGDPRGTEVTSRAGARRRDDPWPTGRACRGGSRADRPRRGGAEPADTQCGERSHAHGRRVRRVSCTAAHRCRRDPCPLDRLDDVVSRR